MPDKTPPDVTSTELRTRHERLYARRLGRLREQQIRAVERVLSGAMIDASLAREGIRDEFPVLRDVAEQIIDAYESVITDA